MADTHELLGLGKRREYPLDPSTVSYSFNKIVKAAGLKVRFHDLRHSCASLMLREGIHPKIVSEMLGHSSVAITLDIYSHVTPGLQEAAAKSLNEVIPEGVVAIEEVLNETR